MISVAKNINAPHRSKGTRAGAVDLQIEGDSREVHLRLKGLEQAFNPVLMAANLFRRRIHDDVVEQIERRFQSETDPTGKPWAPLAPYTEQMRADGGFGPAHPINVRTGTMKRHLLDSPPSIIPTPGSVTYRHPATPGEGDVPNKIKVAQMGGQQSGFRDTPPRPVLGMDESDLALILWNISLHIADFQPGSGTGFFEA